MLLVAELEQTRAQQRSVAQIERRLRLGGGQATCLGLAFGARKPAQVELLQSNFQGRLNDLPITVFTTLEHRAQGFVALYQGIQAAAQQRRIQSSGDANGTRNIVGRALRLQLPEKP